MGLNDTLQCPGLDRTLSTIPLEIPCPKCAATVEVWSDEQKRRCSVCRTLVINSRPVVWAGSGGEISPQPAIQEERLEELTELALQLGSNAATVVESDQILIEESLANLCSETSCPNFGSAPTCPPHVKGPEWLRSYIDNTPKAILLEIQTPNEVLYSESKREFGKLLHFIVVELERAAKEKGFLKSQGFAGGSCKNIFCSPHASCNSLHGDGKCRNPDQSRPSVSGFGINMNHLIRIANQLHHRNESDSISSSRYGLLLIG